MVRTRSMARVVAAERTRRPERESIVTSYRRPDHGCTVPESEFSRECELRTGNCSWKLDQKWRIESAVICKMNRPMRCFPAPFPIVCALALPTLAFQSRAGVNVMLTEVPD